MRCSCCGAERALVALRFRDEFRYARGVSSGWPANWASSPHRRCRSPNWRRRRRSTSAQASASASTSTPTADPVASPSWTSAGQSVFDLGVEDIDPARNRAGCYLVVRDVDDWHTRMAAAGLPVTPVADQPWGMREYALTDPSGNRLRIGQPLS